MDLTLIRNQKLASGIFGELHDSNGNEIAITLEHAYESKPFIYAPKLPPGSYTCIRGPHRLDGMDHDFETFEITGVPGHKGILFHTGNFNDQSNGCCLLGTAKATVSGKLGISGSKIAFNKFLELQSGVNQFTLTVKG